MANQHNYDINNNRIGEQDVTKTFIGHGVQLIKMGDNYAQPSII